MAGPTQIRLDEALTQIADAAHAALVAATEPGGLLEDITEVVKGRRARARPDPPYLWVAIGMGTATQPRALHESWEVALMLNAFVQSEEPQEGWLEALTYAARARSVALADRQLGLAFVEDVQSAELAPLGQSGGGQIGSGRRFGFYARANVRLSIVEPAT